MSGLQHRRWYFFVWDDDNIEHLAAHGIDPDEAEELFFNRYIITPNKKKRYLDRFRIEGRTNGGRKLRLIFQDLGGQVARIFTGWDL